MVTNKSTINRHAAPYGVIFADKPENITSFQALGAVKRRIGIKKVGHTGTLDKFATGLLIILTGWCTKLAPWFSALDKRYVAHLRFGEETETLDPEGDIVATAAVPTVNDLLSVLDKFRGKIGQVPPIYSAVHTGGERAYKLARAGKSVVLAERNVEIFSLEVISANMPDVVMSVHCSKGTYIRSLARDIGVACGSRAHLRGLRRSAVGPFSVEGTPAPDAIDPVRHIVPPAEVLQKLPGLHGIRVSDRVAEIIGHGGKIDGMAIQTLGEVDGDVVISDPQGRMIAMVAREKGQYRYRLVVPEGGN